MLKIDRISAAYGAAPVLGDISFTASPGQITCLMGRNGAGKTTILKTIMGLVRPTGGQIWLNDIDLTRLPPHRVARQGVGYVPQGRRLFGELSVAQNLEIGLWTRNSPALAREQALALFPRLRERLDQQADTLSGGEQQMLAVARALCLRPEILLLDEPTEGLQPSMTALIRDVMVQLRDRGVAIVLVEQRPEAVLSVADQVVFIENGHIGQCVTGQSLRKDPAPLQRYIGV